MFIYLNCQPPTWTILYEIKNINLTYIRHMETYLIKHCPQNLKPVVLARIR